MNIGWLMMNSVFLLQQFIFLAIAIAGIVGAVQVALTREDAFDAADRQKKWAWFAFLVGSSLVTALNFPFLSWIGIIVIGVYWFDVRPQIRDLLNGNYSY